MHKPRQPADRQHQCNNLNSLVQAVQSHLDTSINNRLCHWKDTDTKCHQTLAYLFFWCSSQFCLQIGMCINVYRGLNYF